MDELLCGIDLGGTKLAAGLVSAQGQVLDKITVGDHTSLDDTGVVERISSLTTELLVRSGKSVEDILGIGLSFPGHIRYREGITVTTSNLKGFKNYPLKKELEQRHKTRVLVDNDANAQAYAEFKFGAGVGIESQVFITVSSGIGAGIIINGRVYRGRTGTAGEVGHMIVEPNSEFRCTCGNRGCLMSLASGIALKQIWREYHGAGQAAREDHDASGAIDGKALKKALEAGDAVAARMVEEAARYIGIGLYNMFQLLDPGLFVIGGGLTNLGEAFIDRIRERFHGLAGDMMHEEVRVRLSELGPDAGLIGAASLLLEET